MDYKKINMPFKKRLLFLFTNIIEKSYLINTIDTKTVFNEIENVGKVTKKVEEPKPLEWPTESLFFNEDNTNIKSNL